MIPVLNSYWLSAHLPNAVLSPIRTPAMAPCFNSTTPSRAKAAAFLRVRFFLRAILIKHIVGHRGLLRRCQRPFRHTHRPASPSEGLPVTPSRAAKPSIVFCHGIGPMPHIGAGSAHPIAVDKLAVVDPELRVLGVEGLGVADASVMPRIIREPGTNAASHMIGGRASQLLLGTAKRPSSQL